MKKIFLLDEIDCANCAAKLEESIKKVDKCQNASVNFLTQKMTIEAEDADMAAVVKEVIKICKKMEPDMDVKEK